LIGTKAQQVRFYENNTLCHVVSNSAAQLCRRYTGIFGSKGSYPVTQVCTVQQTSYAKGDLPPLYESGEAVYFMNYAISHEGTEEIKTLADLSGKKSGRYDAIYDFYSNQYTPNNDE
jgi:hypothetical protein